VGNERLDVGGGVWRQEDNLYPIEPKGLDFFLISMARSVVKDQGDFAISKLGIPGREVLEKMSQLGRIFGEAPGRFGFPDHNGREPFASRGICHQGNCDPLFGFFYFFRWASMEYGVELNHSSVSRIRSMSEADWRKVPERALVLTDSVIIEKTSPNLFFFFHLATIFFQK